MKNIIFGMAVAAGAMLLGACTEDSPKTYPPVDRTEVTIERGTYAKGADVSWLTWLESKGYTFATPGENSVTKECMTLLKDDCGVNSIRLRVWVNPADGWSNIDDMVVLARRANDLGLRVMVDFHMSDSWADPGKQNIPEAWADMDLASMKMALADHVTEALTVLKRYGVEPEWVQIGNETTTGMLWPMGKIDNGDNFTQLVNAGYDAVKAVFPESLVIVHIDGGDKQYRYDRVFGKLKDEGGRYDMIGMSIYPDPSNWQSTIDAMFANVDHCRSTYGKPVMLCEIGLDYTEADAAEAMMNYVVANSEAHQLKGVFWWEPEAPQEEGYKKGCFDNGVPTSALNAFKNK